MLLSASQQDPFDTANLGLSGKKQKQSHAKLVRAHSSEPRATKRISTPVAPRSKDAIERPNLTGHRLTSEPLNTDLLQARPADRPTPVGVPPASAAAMPSAAQMASPNLPEASETPHQSQPPSGKPTSTAGASSLGSSSETVVGDKVLTVPHSSPPPPKRTRIGASEAIRLTIIIIQQVKAEIIKATL